MKEFFRFVGGSVRIVTRGRKMYYAWLGVLVLLIIQGALAYAEQFRTGLVLTDMRDPLSWGFYIGNFTFLVGVAAAAVMLVIPAYVYHWKPMREVVIFGELLAIAAILMCLLFVLVDMGHPERFWHLIPFLGTPNLPSSILAWDAMVLNVYLALNLVVATYLIFCAFYRRDYNHSVVTALVILSIPAAVSIHTVTAFLYNGMASRPYWNSAILAPRFLASAFCSGPAILLILFQVLRRTTRFEIQKEALHKIAELMAYAMAINLFLFGAEVFREYYSNTEHLVHTQYLFSGLHGHPSPIAKYAWGSVILGIVAFVLFLIPAARRHPVSMNLGCVMIYISVYIEKGIALIVPGYTPDVLGQIYEYVPSITEVRVSVGIFSVGFLAFTLMVKVAIGVLFGDIHAANVRDGDTLSPATAQPAG
ncbi:MAG: polysulfide reductase NrfD [Verrucomicrobia bacterium]|nr:polysulfide reductase NrfD [Verrucomicrobiota bacterium]MDA1087099.1 polysulfide reductase NrfD [Verrucomicrobiota bacterium]